MECLIDPWKADRNTFIAKAAEAVYYLAVVGAIVAGILGTHGILGQNFHNFMHMKLNNYFTTGSWAAIGFGAAMLPSLLRKIGEIYQERQKSPLSPRTNSPRNSKKVKEIVGDNEELIYNGL